MPTLFKTCRICKIEKPLNEYYPNGRTNKDGTRNKRTECAECCRKRRRAYFQKQDKRDRINYMRRYRYSKDEGERQRDNRRHALKALYGLTPEQVDAMAIAQNHRCALCALPESEAPKKRLFVDHCHETDKIRGLLCQNCNSAIGLIYEDVAILQKMIEYLILHK